MNDFRILYRRDSTYSAFDNYKLAEFALVATLLMLLGVHTPPVFGGKDVSLSQVPQAVRDTIERETKGFDAERKKKIGKKQRQ